ncbi:hypothetical protein GQX73_g5520 [Xylaria multiplex]|uniref:Uncharacterized protein n=1 Tax=Xylaria multiplex TaxID=323545 RepID=A0A7C8N6Y5_9PEZI|nr:hypothetical protein GQX73_g5520 [Xylaria multiplex]
MRADMIGENFPRFLLAGNGIGSPPTRTHRISNPNRPAQVRLPQSTAEATSENVRGTVIGCLRRVPLTAYHLELCCRSAEQDYCLMDALCFFCVSRAVAETGENNGISYVAAFNESLEQWRMIFPEIEDVVRLMWNVTFQSVPQPRPTAEQHSELLQLREAVAALIIDADSMFGLCVPDARDEMEASSDCNQRLSRSTDHASLHKDLPGHLLTPREKEPLGRLICPAITSLQEKTHRTPLSELVKLVTTVIFALVVYFVLGFAHISSPMVLGLSNPWYTEIPQTTSTYQSTSYDVSSSSYTETANPSLLPRPSPPFNPFRPNFDVASSPIPVLDQSSLEIFSLSPFREEDGLEFGIAN